MKKTLDRLKQHASEKVAEMSEKVAEMRGDHKAVADMDDFDLAAERDVNDMKGAYTTLVKRLAEVHPLDEDDKLAKRVPQHNLGVKMMALGEEYGDRSSFGSALLKCGRIQLDLGTLQVGYHRSVVEGVIRPLQSSLTNEFPALQEERKRVLSSQTAAENAKSRFVNSCTKNPKLSPSEQQEKMDAAKEDLAVFQAAFDSSKGTYAARLEDFLSRDAEFIQPLATLLELQIAHFQSSLRLLEASAASVREIQKQSTGRRRAFGAPVPPDSVDPILTALCAVIQRDGISTEGIFRKAGSKLLIQRLRAAFNAGGCDLSTPDSYDGDIYAVGALVKMFLRELPEPLLTFAAYDSLLAAARLPDHDQKLSTLQALVAKLPAGHWRTLAFLMHFLANVAAHGEKNLMHSKNLAIVFGPNLLWQPNNDMTLADTGAQTHLCDLLIMYHEWFFPPGAEPPTPAVLVSPTGAAAPARPPSRQHSTSAGSSIPSPPARTLSGMGVNPGFSKPVAGVTTASSDDVVAVAVAVAAPASAAAAAAPPRRSISSGAPEQPPPPVNARPAPPLKPAPRAPAAASSDRERPEPPPSASKPAILPRRASFPIADPASGTPGGGSKKNAVWPPPPTDADG